MFDYCIVDLHNLNILQKYRMLWQLLLDLSHSIIQSSFTSKRMMRNSRYKIASVFCFAFAIALLFMIQPPSDSPPLTSSTIHSPNGRYSFPPRFIFGTASAAYQYEGAANEDGRGPSIWDTFSHTPGKIQDNSNGDVALDHYHRYKEDIQLMKKMGVDAYRFSVSWSRILPDGTVDGGVNKAGVNFYNNVINELIRNGIKPYITLYHWDLPQALQDKYKGFLNKQIVEDFKGFAEICFREFGDRVKNWITMNEPWTFTAVGYDFGSHAPGRCSKFIRNCTEGNSAVEPYIVAHHILLAHGAAVSIYREKYQASQKGTIGISLSCHWMMPYSENVDDQKAAQRALDFMFGWFMDPISSGEYPISMREMVGDRLPEFTEKQAHSLKGSFDFIGLNYYTARYAIHEPNKPDPMWTSSNADTQVKQTAEKNGVSLGVTGASDWLYVFPQGLRDLLLYIKNRYNNPPIFITENGIDEFNKEDISLQQALNDTHRVDYFEKHLDAVKEAISEGANVRGFFAWSLLDNFEWAMGYTVRFGLHYVDFKDNLKRYPKASALWFASFLG